MQSERRDVGRELKQKGSVCVCINHSGYAAVIMKRESRVMVEGLLPRYTMVTVAGTMEE